VAAIVAANRLVAFRRRAGDSCGGIFATSNVENGRTEETEIEEEKPEEISSETTDKAAEVGVLSCVKGVSWAVERGVFCVGSVLRKDVFGTRGVDVTPPKVGLIG